MYFTPDYSRGRADARPGLPARKQACMQRRGAGGCDGVWEEKQKKGKWKKDCVIVKDLSRLGRDYIETGRLIYKTFPVFSVRFIALNDNFDSLTANFNEKTLVLPVKNFINDAYCSDISQRVRSHQQIKREKGDFIGAFAVYGYRKNPANINQLLVDKYASQIVRKIFAWKIAGVSNLAIAKKLNEMGILSPMEYKKSQGENFSTGFITHIKAKWSAVAVKRILTNEMYIGIMVQGKNKKVSYKVKRVEEKPREEWVRVENTHDMKFHKIIQFENMISIKYTENKDFQQNVCR